MFRAYLREVSSPVQRQSFVISMSAFFAGVLLISLIGILLLILFRGSAYFWPAPVYLVEYQNEKSHTQHVYAQVRMQYEESGEPVWWVKYSNQTHPYSRQTLVDEKSLRSRVKSARAAVIDLKDGRTILAEPVALNEPNSGEAALGAFDSLKEQVGVLSTRIEALRSEYLAPIHEELAELDVRGVDAKAPARVKLNTSFRQWQQKVHLLEQERAMFTLVVKFADGEPYQIPLNDIYSVVATGALSTGEKWLQAGAKVWRFMSESPKQANTAGGVFPALFGTILMVLMMTLMVTPFGVLAAVYLNEYAPDNTFTTVIRISVSNMAAVPSIVYGVFGLGFFIYTVGGNLDALFFSEYLPAPTLGTPGLFWASLTMAILTLPVVIVATEEGLRRVPEGLKAGSYALGATKSETVLYTILPIASPGIMTGIILAIARAAGEVAPLMLVGAVKFAPALPVDGTFPYLHLDRQFMHLGVLIYDGAFHSQTDAKGSSMMFAACMLLLIVVFILNILAVVLRARLRQRYLRG